MCGKPPLRDPPETWLETSNGREATKGKKERQRARGRARCCFCGVSGFRCLLLHL